MPGLFGNLTLAAKALQAQQVAIGVTGRNIANVNNPEYARQRVLMGDRYSVATSTGPEGTGVEVLQVQQLRDTLLDRQVVRQASDTQFLKAQEAALSNAELALGDRIDAASTPTSVNDTTNSTTGIGGALDDFFNAMETLAASPSEVPVRDAAIQSAKILADRINNADGRLSLIQDDLELQIRADLDKANGLLRDIARLNGEIRDADSRTSGGAADLIDRRQKKLEDLSSILRFDLSTPTEAPNQVEISLGGQVLVTYGVMPKGDDPLVYTPTSPRSNGTYPIAPTSLGKFSISGVDITSTLTSGSAYGRYLAMTGYTSGSTAVSTGSVAWLRSQLDTFSKQLSSAVKAKYNNQDFFLSTPSAGLLLEVKSTLTSSTLVTGPSGNAGDSAYIKSIASLRRGVFSTTPGSALVDTTNGDKINGKLGDYVRTTIGMLAQNLRSISTRADEAGVIDSAIRVQRDSVSGVSLDEETTNMMQYQRAYQANAKVISVLDTLLESIINSMIR
ncbi:MAG: Flagellar hook-associated protein 1 [Verrucomicrobiota bacterium]|jgi:flagellar hook-associated protein 1 FlgK